MEYSLLGPTGVKLSKICVGTATFGVAPDAQESDVNGMEEVRASEPPWALSTIGNPLLAESGSA
jgi:hypothetical protein